MKYQVLLLWSAIALSLGILLYDFCPAEGTLYVAGSLFVVSICGIGWAWYKKYPGAALWGSVLLLCLAGFARMELADRIWMTESAWAIRGEGLYQGVIMEPPLVSEEDSPYARYLVRLETLHFSDGEEKSLEGTAYVYSSDTKQLYEIGERIAVAGKLSPIRVYQNPGKIDLEGRYKSRRLLGRIYPSEGAVIQPLGDSGDYRIGKWAEAIKKNLEKKFAPYMDDSRLHILMTLLFGGNYNEISKDVMQSFSVTGIVHILSVSGSHVALLFGFLYFLGKWLHLPQKLVLIGAMSLVLCYALLAGLVPPVIRAAVMGILSVGGIFLEREKATLNLLGAAVTGMLLWDPFYLYDVSFQLSAGASAGLLIFYQPILSYMQKIKHLPKWIGEGTSLALAAQILTLPIVLYDFHNFPLFFIPANLFVAPFLEWVIIAGLLAALASLLFMPLAGGILQLADYFLWLALRLNFFLSSLPKAAWGVGGMNGWQVLTYYVTVGLVYFRKWICQSKKQIGVAIAVWGSLVLLVLFLYLTRPAVRVYVPDLGPDQGMVLVNGKQNILYYKGGGVSSHTAAWEWNSFLGYEGIFEADILILNVEDVKDTLPLTLSIPVKEIWITGGKLSAKAPKLLPEKAKVRELSKAELAYGPMRFMSNGSSWRISFGDTCLYLSGKKGMSSAGKGNHTLWLAGHEGWQALTEKEIQSIAPEAVIYSGSRLQRSWESKELFEVLGVPFRDTYTDGMQEAVFDGGWVLVTGDW